MASRLELHEMLCEILGSRNVYFQPPASVSMKYPAIVYNLNDIENIYSNTKVYGQKISYSVIIIDPNPDSKIGYEFSKRVLCSFERFYTSNNLNHFVYTLYY